MGSNGNKWDRNQILTLIGVIIAAATLIASVVIPEIRRCFSLKDGNPPVPSPEPAPVPAPKPEITPLKPSPLPRKPLIEEKQPDMQPQTAAPKEKKPAEKPKTPSGPFSATLHENQPQFIEAAKTSLSIVFNEEYKIVTLTIAPDGKQSSNRAILNGYDEKFTSSAGDFLLHVLNIDWNSRTITVQVSN